jgi:autotransporter passenger strand-loop-strand repeat protein
MAIDIVSSGNTLVGFTLLSGDKMIVLSGGQADNTNVSSGGLSIVSSGGETFGDTVFAGGVETLLSGATASGLIVSSGGALTGAGVLSGTLTDLGLVSGVTIVSAAGGFGSMTVGLHGVASGVTVNDSFAFIQSGGAARHLQAVDGSMVVISAGGATTGTVFGSGGGAESVSGTVHGTVLSSGALENVFGGGVADGTVVSSGGEQWISSGAVASSAVVLAGGSQSVFGSGRTTATMVASGGGEFVSSGGVAQNTVIASGGTELVQSGGVASGFAVSSGGFLTVSSGGLLQVGATGTSTNFGQIDAKSTAEMDLAGTLVNGGQIALENSNTLEVKAAKATLTGSGVINLDNADLITGLAKTDVLDNESDTIAGTGQFGGESLTVINRGTIDANLAGGLTLNATLVTNTGLIEATNGASLNVLGPINNSGGVIKANGGDIFLEAGSTISGGVLAAAAVATGEFFTAGSAELDGTALAITNKAVVNVGDGTQLTLAGAIDNAGVISMASSADNTDLVVDGATVTLTGSGRVEMSANFNNRIFGDATTFTNVLDNVDNTIEGAGEIGAGKLVLANSGTVDADNGSVSLEIDTTSTTNTGLMEATGAGGLIFETTVNNSGGVIAANQANVILEASTQILGGILASTPFADIVVANTGSGAVTLNGTASPLTNAGNIELDDGYQLDLVGAIVNEGKIWLSGGADFTNLVVNGTSATLTGGGVVELSDSANNRIYGAVAADKLINVNNTIEGSGEIGLGELSLVNSGTIDATGVSNSLVLDATSTINTGLLESTTNAGLVIKSIVRNSGGVIAATNGGNVFLDAGAVISGGQLLATQFAYFFVQGAGATLSGTAASPLTNSATVYIQDAAQLNLAGAIVNDGIVSLNAVGDSTELVVSGPNATVTGSGALELTDSADNIIMGVSAADTLTNATNTIEGSGQLGNGQLTLINKGTIDATGSNNQLVLRRSPPTPD